MKGFSLLSHDYGNGGWASSFLTLSLGITGEGARVSAGVDCCQLHHLSWQTSRWVSLCNLLLCVRTLSSVLHGLCKTLCRWKWWCLWARLERHHQNTETKLVYTMTKVCDPLSLSPSFILSLSILNLASIRLRACHSISCGDLSSPLSAHIFCVLYRYSFLSTVSLVSLPTSTQ